MTDIYYFIVSEGQKSGSTLAVVLAQGLLGGFIRAVGRGCTHLKAGLGLEVCFHGGSFHGSWHVVSATGYWREAFGQGPLLSSVSLPYLTVNFARASDQVRDQVRENEEEVVVPFMI